MIHTSARGIAQLGFHIAEEEDAAVDVPQLSFSGYILHRTSGVPMGAPRISKQGVADREIV